MHRIAGVAVAVLSDVPWWRGVTRLSVDPSAPTAGALLQGLPDDRSKSELLRRLTPYLAAGTRATTSRRLAPDAIIRASTKLPPQSAKEEGSSSKRLTRMGLKCSPPSQTSHNKPECPGRFLLFGVSPWALKLNIGASTGLTVNLALVRPSAVGPYFWRLLPPLVDSGRAFGLDATCALEAL
jgi:hypothetical protein